MIFAAVVLHHAVHVLHFVVPHDLCHLSGVLPVWSLLLGVHLHLHALAVVLLLLLLFLPPPFLLQQHLQQHALHLLCEVPVAAGHTYPGAPASHDATAFADAPTWQPGVICMWFLYTYKNIYTHAPMHLYIPTCTCTHTHTRTCTCIHTQHHMNTQTPPKPPVVQVFDSAAVSHSISNSSNSLKSFPSLPCAAGGLSYTPHGPGSYSQGSRLRSLPQGSLLAVWYRGCRPRAPCAVRGWALRFQRGSPHGRRGRQRGSGVRLGPE